jgi:hypothetical protein|tara:strand:+ start:1791 stop:1979 length:189 start_codon:yes stop_codon:yes gene_type:complete
MINDLKKGLAEGLGENVGILEYVFGIICVVFLLPVLTVYLLIAKLIVLPISKIKLGKLKFWK